GRRGPWRQQQQRQRSAFGNALRAGWCRKLELKRRSGGAAVLEEAAVGYRGAQRPERSVLAEAGRRADQVAWGGRHVLVAAAGEGHGAVSLRAGVAAAFAAVDGFQQRWAERPAVAADAHRTRGISHAWW